MRTSSARVRQCSASLRKDWLVMPGSVCESVIVMVRLAGVRVAYTNSTQRTNGWDRRAAHRNGTAFSLWRAFRATYICRPSIQLLGSGIAPRPEYLASQHSGRLAGSAHPAALISIAQECGAFATY